jgi:hypothetical protein
MSSLIGRPGERLSLPRVVDALSEAARQAGRPAFVWLAGLAYPNVLYSFLILASVLEAAQGDSLAIPMPVPMLPSAPFVRLETTEALAALVIGLPVWLALYRLVTGLSWLSSPALWDRVRVARRSPRLRDAWRAGHGVTWSGFGLFLVTRLLNFAALLVVLAPVLMLLGLLQLDGDLILSAALAVPALLLLLYGFALEVLTQLALHSLAHNRRGLASALQHAWRLVRGDPLAVVRSTLVDLAAQLLLLTATWLSTRLGCCIAWALWPAAVLLLGYLGVVRAAFWARIYKALGGLTAAEGVPGLTPVDSGDEPVQASKG